MRELYEGIASYEPVQWYRRRKMDPPQWALDCKEKMHHPYLYLEDPKRMKINNHMKCKRLIEKLGIDSRMRQIHYFAGEENWNTFIYIEKSTHQMLHILYGQRDKNIGIDKLRKHLDDLISDGYALFVDGKLVEYTKHSTPSAYWTDKLGMKPVLVDSNSLTIALKLDPGLSLTL